MNRLPAIVTVLLISVAAVEAQETPVISPWMLMYERIEGVQVETELLRSRGNFHSHGSVASDVLTTGTVGAVVDIPKWHRFEVAVGAETTSYVVPDTLKTAYGDRPIAFRLFLRIRPPAGAMGRMWNTQMARPMH